MFVPFSADTVRQALADPVRIARCVPGFQRDADAAPDALVGRMRLRIGHSTITYRGRLRITEQDGGDLAVEGEGTEARGSGWVKLTLNVRLSAADGGSVLSCTGTVRSEGRLPEAGEAASAAAGRRLLDRFAAELTTGLESSPIGTDDGDDNQRVIPGIPSPESGDRKRPAEASGKAETPKNGEAPSAGSEEEAASAPGAEQPQPPPAPGERAEADHSEADLSEADLSEADLAAGDEEELESEPPAEAAHARRTMIGRSAEEVDHAPPRGRYAPFPAPDTASTTATLRWAAPAAAAVVASAVVIGRMLRRRR
ncbi:SRPBCC domain-containing protein [Streptomyces sp. NPDC004647]|uniref:SRPBCC domain-containing protein n=1 Tax=Streptomyces sp. NPDC004647 TaxID=3154671 RepID=UPI0033AFC307